MRAALLAEMRHLSEQLNDLKSTVINLRETVALPKIAKKLFTPKEFGELPGVDRERYTVSEWCRLGRVNARKADAGRGEDGEWRIAWAEYERYLNEGLLPDPNKLRGKSKGQESA